MESARAPDHATLVPVEHAAVAPGEQGPLAGVEVHLDETFVRAHSDLGDGVVLMQGERFLHVNDAFCRITGYARDDLLDPRFRLDDLWAPHERERMRERMRRRLAGEVLEDHYEVALAPLWGSLVHVEVSVRPVPSSHGRLRLAILRDVTARKLAQEELEAVRRQVAQSEKMAVLGSLVSGVAHEVRTPLSYIQNNLYLARARLEPLARQQDATPAAPEVAAAVRDALAHLQQVQEGADRVNRLVKDLARFTRLPTEPVRCRLEEVVAEAIELFRVTHPAVGVTIHEDLEPTPPLMLDKSKIQQVVLNLVGNAVEALRHGGTVRVATQPLPTGASLAVRDDGPGIPPEHLCRIFEPFYTTKSEGMGLGLSIVRRLVELHRGTIRCDSSPGNGTTFTIHLPA